MYRHKAFVVVKEFPWLRVITKVWILISPPCRVVDYKVVSVRCEVRKEILLLLSRFLICILLLQRGDQPVVENESPYSLQDYKQYCDSDVLLNKQAKIAFLLIWEPVLDISVLQLRYNVRFKIKHHF